MSRASDYYDEMTVPHLLDDATAEELLAGRVTPRGMEPVAELVAVLRASTNRPVPPSPALAELLTAGFDPALRPQGRGLGTAASWRRIVVRWLAAVPRKARWIAVVAAAAAAVVGVSSAGFAGALPEPVQHQFETVVESVTPYEFPQRPDGASDFGRRVSEDARDGGVDGPEVSEEAKQQGKENRPTDLPTPAKHPGPPEDRGPPAELPGPPEHPGGGNPGGGQGKGRGGPPTAHPGQGGPPPGQAGQG